MLAPRNKHEKHENKMCLLILPIFLFCYNATKNVNLKFWRQNEDRTERKKRKQGEKGEKREKKSIMSRITTKSNTSKGEMYIFPIPVHCSGGKI